MDQSNRYAALDLKEEDLIKGGQHILCAYKITAAHLALLPTAMPMFVASSGVNSLLTIPLTPDDPNRPIQ